MIGKTISHYRILGQVGEGGMGVVYVAEDTRLSGRRVAVKIPHAGKDEKQYRSRFMREARAVSVVTHKNIAAIYDVGETPEGKPFIVMELVTGQTLGEILMGTGLSLARSVEITQDVADALSEAHRRGIVHRDIKPSNVIVNERGEVKVLDFGLAKQFEDENGSASRPDAQTLLSTQTRSDVVIGTPLYLSPEQARGGRVDGRSDVFALGALLYECVAGRPAFSGANVIEIGAQVLHVDPPPPSQFNSRIPAELDRVVMKALAKRVEDRYQTAGEMANDLEAVRARLPGSDSARTRRIAGPSGFARSSMLVTISDKMRRPRISPLAFLVTFAAAVLLVLGYLYWSAPSLHVPKDEARALYEHGVIAMREGTYYKAVGLLEQAVQVDDKFALAHARLAEALAELDYFALAMEKMVVAKGLIPERSALDERDALYLDAINASVLRNWGNAAEVYDKIAKLEPERAQVYLDLGRAQEKNSQTAAAVDSYTKATERDEAYAVAHTRLGVVCARQKNLACASDSFERAEKLFQAQKNVEGLTEALYQRGRLYTELGRGAEARRDLEKSLELARGTKNRYQQVQALMQLSTVLASDNKVDDAIDLASQALNMAQADNMYNLAVRAAILLAAAHMVAGNYAEAERLLDQAIKDARNYKLHQHFAMALFNKASMLDTRLNRSAEALPLYEELRKFYGEGGYRKEADSVDLLIARVGRKQGNYAGALDTFRKQLDVANQSGDQQQIGLLRREYGAVLLAQERYPEAVKYFGESTAIYKALGHKALHANSLLSLSSALWRAGHYDRAAEALDEATASAGGNKDLLAALHAERAWLELSRGDIPKARARAKEALALGGNQPTLVAEVGGVLCLASARSGSAAKDKALCVDSLDKSKRAGDPWFVANAELSLAEALLEARDYDAAREAAQRAYDIVAPAGRLDSAWRAMAVAGAASRRAGDAEGARGLLARAKELLTKLEPDWGSEAMSVYLTRPDLQFLRRELDGHTTAAPKP